MKYTQYVPKERQMCFLCQMLILGMGEDVAAAVAILSAATLIV